MINKKKKSLKGFTLVELVVVIAVIAILAGVAVGAYFGITNSATVSKLEQEARVALTNVKLIGSEGNKNHTLNKDGIYIDDLDLFDTKYDEMSGGSFYFKEGNVDQSKVYGYTLYFFNKVDNNVSNLYKVNTTYNHFAYYSPEVLTKRAIVDIVNNKITVEDFTFTLEEEPSGDSSNIPTDSPIPSTPDIAEEDRYIEFVDIEDTLSLYVGEEYKLNINRDASSIYYEFIIGNEEFISIEYDKVKGLKEGSTTLRVQVEDNPEICDEIIVIVNKVTASSLVVNGLNNKSFIEGQSVTLNNELSYTLNLSYGDPVSVSASSITISPLVFSVGDTQVTFYYEGEYGKTNLTVTGFSIDAKTVDHLTSNMEKIPGKYYEGDTIDLTGISFDVHYDNGTFNKLELSELDYSNVAVKGQTAVRFTYLKGTASEVYIDIPLEKVEAILLQELSFIKDDSLVKTIYRVGDTPLKDGLTFMATFNNTPLKKEVDKKDIKVSPETIESTTTEIVYSYTYNEITCSCRLPIEITTIPELLLYGSFNYVDHTENPIEYTSADDKTIVFDNIAIRRGEQFYFSLPNGTKQKYTLSSTSYCTQIDDYIFEIQAYAKYRFTVSYASGTKTLKIEKTEYAYYLDIISKDTIEGSRFVAYLSDNKGNDLWLEITPGPNENYPYYEVTAPIYSIYTHIGFYRMDASKPENNLVYVNEGGSLLTTYYSDTIYSINGWGPVNLLSAQEDADSYWYSRPFNG